MQLHIQLLMEKKIYVQEYVQVYAHNLTWALKEYVYIFQFSYINLLQLKKTVQIC